MPGADVRAAGVRDEARLELAVGMIRLVEARRVTHVADCAAEGVRILADEPAESVLVVRRHAARLGAQVIGHVAPAGRGVLGPQRRGRITGKRHVSIEEVDHLAHDVRVAFVQLPRLILIDESG